MRDQSIVRIMTSEPATVNVDEPAAKAVQILETEAIHHLPVVEDGRLVGIVSTPDLLKLYLLGDDPPAANSIPVRQIMQKDPVVVASSSNLRDAAEMLSTGSFHALPVVDTDGLLVGIVTSTDLIQHLLMQIPRGDGSLAEVSTAALQTRNRVLEEVCRAVELYIRSGHAEHEHSVLLKKLAAARVSDDVTL